MKRLIGFTCALIALQSVAFAAEKPAPKTVTVPFELLKTGHMTIMAKINGKGPYKFIFDTGCPVILLNSKVAKDAHLLDGVKKPAFAPFGTMGEVKIKSLEANGSKAENVSAIVMEHPTVGAIAEFVGNPIEGIVGFPYFARFKMAIDYQAKTLTLTPNGYQPPESLQALAMSITGEKVKVLAPPARWGFAVTKKEGDEEPGVDVKQVMSDSPVAKAGLKKGDRVLTIDGRWTDSVGDLYQAATYVKAGTTVPVVVQRDGKEVELKVTPEKGL